MPSEPYTADPVLDAIHAGQASILVTNWHDLAVRGGRPVYWPEYLAEALSRDYVVLRYAKADGARVDGYAGLAPEERDALDRRLNAVGLRALLHREGPHNGDEVR